MKNIYGAILVIAMLIIGQQAKPQFILIDNFSNAVQGNLVGQTSDGPSNLVWSATKSASSVIITNSSTPGVGVSGSGTPLTPNAAMVTSSDGADNIKLPVAISTTSTQATIFLQFDMGPSQTANDVNWDLANSTGGASGDGGGAQNQIELNANAPGRAGITINDGVNGTTTKNFVELSADGVHVFTPLNSTVYDVWYVIDNASNSFLIYMQDASPAGADLPGLTRMWVATASGNTPTTFTTNAVVYRAASTVQPMSLFNFGPGGGDNVPTGQFVYSLYEDPNFADLTNPVTGVAPATLSPPVITSQPQPAELYAGATAVFSVGATGGGLNYQWLSNNVPLVNSGNISGSTSSTLIITNVLAADAANYSCAVNNANTSGYKSTNSAAAALTIVTPNGAFETALAADGPLHFYAFDDTGNPATGTEVAFDYAGGDNGLYGANSQNGYNSIAGPRPVPDGFPGFSSSNYAVEFSSYNEPSHVTVGAPWNLNTNTVTITAWINPSSLQDNLAAVVLNRGGGSDVEGLIFNNSGNSTLGYDWNNDPGTTSWDSGLQPPVGQWSFVALVVTSTNATISMMNTNGLVSSTHVYAHTPAAFDGATTVGDDSGTGTGSLTFGGSIDEVGVFNQALSESQLQAVFTNASGIAMYAPTNTVALVTPSPIYPGEAAQFSSIVGGSTPLSFTWQLNNVNLADGANSVGIISGSASPSLTISNLAVADAGNSYNLTLVTSNSSGSYTSSVPAVLTVSTPNPATTIYTLGFEAAGDDWNTGTNWSDGNPASVSAYSEPGSVYQIAPGTMERTPISTNASFPGSVLAIEGDGVLIDGGSTTFTTNTTTGELRLKQSGSTSVTNFGTIFTDGGSVYFPDLKLNGGQIDNGTSSKSSINGKMDILTNSTIYADSAADGSIRTIQINSFLTGAGTITYSYLSSNFTNNDLIISGATNIFSGQWDILQGTLLGNAANSLGTNTITVGTNGALETTYNIYNPKGDLFLNGRMFLYTSNTFNAVAIGGVSLAAGTYTSAQLNSLFPASFPTNWPVQVGSTTGTNTGLGYITVLTTLVPVITQQPTPASLSLYPGQTAQFAAAAFGELSYQWWFTNLSNVGVKLADGGTTSGSQGAVLTISNVVNADAGTYTLVVTNTAGSTNSSSAMLTILTPGPATTITMSVVETAGEDWNSGTNWSDGNPASLSAYSEPGSTYEVLPGAVLRTPASTSNAAFPGTQLVIAGGGELLLEHLGATSIAFPDLQLYGGLMDNGANGLATLTGQLDISNNVTVYTDSNAPAALVVNFDVPGGIGGTNYDGPGAYPDQTGHVYWNPVPGTGGTTPPQSTNSDGVTVSGITLTCNTGAFGVGGTYGTYDNSANTATNTAPALEDNYLWVADNLVPSFALGAITNEINDVPPGTYDLYLYGNNGGHSTGYEGLGDQNNWGTIFTVSSDLAPATSLATSNNPISYTSNSFIQGVDYVVFSNVVVGAGETITFDWTGNTNIAGNLQGAFNGFQLVTAVGTAVGPRPIAIDSLLTGSGTINCDAGDTNFESDLDIAGAANTFSGPWNVIQGTLLGSAAGSLGTNSIVVGTNGALETLYNINDTNAGLILNGKMFLHTSDVFNTLTVNGAVVNAGTYSFAQLNQSFPGNFPATWPKQTNSSINTGSGQITVLSPGGTSSTTTLVIQHSGSNLVLSWTNGGTLQTTTNLLGAWTTVVGASSPFTVFPTNGPDQFYRVHP